jgi:GAF domain-containing protein
VDDAPDDHVPIRPGAATSEVFRLLGDGAAAVAEHLERQAQGARALVPDLLGVSLTYRGDGGCFTVTATDDEARRLDAVQYLDGGPCPETSGDDHARCVHTEDPLSEESWAMFARASAGAGVASSLSLPLRVGEEVVGSLNLYAGSPGAFDAHLDELAALAAAPPEEAVRDADLGFTTREDAEATLREVEARVLVQRAAAALSRREGLDADQAATRIEVAAVRAGVPAHELARLVLEVDERRR